MNSRSAWIVISVLALVILGVVGLWNPPPSFSVHFPEHFPLGYKLKRLKGKGSPELKRKVWVLRRDDGEELYVWVRGPAYGLDKVEMITFDENGDFVAGTYIDVSWILKTKVSETEIPFKPWEYGEQPPSSIIPNFGWDQFKQYLKYRDREIEHFLKKKKEVVR